MSRRGVMRALVALPLLAGAGCNYSFSAGSFPPPHVKTIAVSPFDNETARFELSGEVYDELLRELPRALGIRTAGEDVADAVVRGTITRYDVVAPSYRANQPGQPPTVLERQVNISASIQIVDLVDNVILWEDRNVIAQGQYADATETEDVGRAEAIKMLIQKIVDGAQSNW